MNADESNHNGHTKSGLQTLLPNATVTIRFDGLIYTAYDAGQRVYQAAVHAVNADHHLTIEVMVEEDGKSKKLFPDPPKWPWDAEYGELKENAPFWLYVDSGNGRRPEEFSAQLYLPKNSDERSFDHILNFQSLYDRKITLDPKKFIEFNFPHGTCYSAENKKATRTKVDGKGNPISRKTEMTVSRTGAIDIDLVSDKRAKREIVLMNKKGRIFYFPLEHGKHYFINVYNQPKHSKPTGQANHFLLYYDLFPLVGDEQRYLLNPEATNTAKSVHSPPCISASGDLDGGLP